MEQDRDARRAPGDACCRPHAWDGADLPSAQRAPRSATTVLDVGQTADFLFTPPRRGAYRLTVTSPGGQPHLEQRIVVR